MFGVPSVAGCPFGSDRRFRGGRRCRSDRRFRSRSRGRGFTRRARGYPLVHDPRPRPLFVLLFVLHGNRYTCFLIHAKKGPTNSHPLTSRPTRSRWGYGVADRASCPVNR